MPRKEIKRKTVVPGTKKVAKRKSTVTTGTKKYVDKVSGQWAESRFLMGAAYKGDKVTRAKKADGYDYKVETKTKSGKKKVVKVEVKYGTAKLSPNQKKAQKKLGSRVYKVKRYPNMI